MEYHVRSLMGFAMLLLSCTACSFTEEAMDNQETQMVTVMEDVQMDRPQEMEHYMVYRAVPKSQEALARPEWYFPDESAYRQQTDIADDAQIWEDDQGNSLALDKNHIGYCTSAFYATYAELLQDEEGGFRSDFDDLLTEGTVEAVSEQEAVNRITGLAEKNNIAFDNTAAYPLSVENLTKLSRLFMSDEEYEEAVKYDAEPESKRTFVEEDEAWLVVLTPCVKEWPLYQEEYDYEERFYPACRVWGIVSANGLECFEASGLYDTEDEPVREISGMSMDQAKECLQRKFEGIMGDDVVECTKIELSYLAAGDGTGEKLEWIPVFIFYVNESFTREKGTSKEEITMQDTLILDIETEKWVE